MARIVNVESIGKQKVYDLGIHQHHNMICNGIVVHNCMKTAQILSGFDPIQANKLRSVIGKKKKDQIPKMKQKFLNGALPRIDNGEVTQEEVVAIWELIESFGGYGFNKSLNSQTLIVFKDMKGKKSKKYIKDFKSGDIVYCFDGDKIVETDVIVLHDHGMLEGIEIEFDDGQKEICSINHKFLTSKGMIPLWKILKEDLDILSYAKKARNMVVRKIVSTRNVGKVQMYDLEVSHSSHNYLLASGIVSSNSHAIAYSAVTSAELWLKHNFKAEYMTAVLNNTKLNQKKHGNDNILVKYINYCRSSGIKFLAPDINTSQEEFDVTIDKVISYSLSHIRMIGKCAKQIVGPNLKTNENGVIESVEVRPYLDFKDFYSKIDKQKINLRVMKNLIYSGAFDKFGKELCLVDCSNPELLTVADYRNAIQAVYHEFRYKPKARAERVKKVPKPPPAFDAIFYEKNGKKLKDFKIEGFSIDLFKNLDDLYKKTDRKKFGKANINKLIYSGQLDSFGNKLIEDNNGNGIQQLVCTNVVDSRNSLLAELHRILHEPKIPKRPKKEPPPPENLTLEEYQAKEKEVLGLCLSKPVLLSIYGKLVQQKGWATISDADYKGDCYVFGRIDRIEASKSKAGKSMFRIYLTDDIDEMMFFVFEGDRNEFKHQCQPNGIYAIPTKRFDNSKQRFFTGRKDIFKVFKPKPVQQQPIEK